MKKHVFFSLLALVMICWSMVVLGQTNPTAVSLPFSMTSQNSATLPAGVAVHRWSSIQTTRTLSPANGGDLPNKGSSPLLATGGWYHLGTDGLGLLASGSNPAGAVVVAINTTGMTDIEVSWICRTIKNQSSRDNSIALQYRVGTSGNFIDVGTTTTYSSAGNANGHASGTLTETLPAGAENQSVVQVRWIYWESVSTSGSRDKISVDDILITGTTSSSCSAPTGLAAANITTTAADISWNTVSGASGYEYALTSSSTPPSSGAATISTSFQASGLTPATQYYAHVRTDCSSSFSGWSTESFITADSSEEDSSGIVIVSYNLLNYPGSTGSSREPSYRIIMNDIDPDIVVAQEVLQSTGASNFLNNVLNYSTSSYSAATFIDGYDTDNALYYKTSRFQFVSNTPIETALRDINEFRLIHLASGDTLIIYSVHLKASSGSTNEALRAAEVDSLRKVTDALDSGKFFLVCGDFNIYGAGESAYQNLLANGNNVNGKFYDLLSLSGTWNNASYAVHHTQSPRTTSFGGGATGGLDDRFDMFLFSNTIIQTGGFEIVSGSYKAYGNDGQHYNQALNTPPYTQYSSTIASAIHDASDHLPVVVEFVHTGGSSSLTIGRQNISTRDTEDQRSATSVEEDPVSAPTITVYPNPVNGQLFIRIQGNVETPVHLCLTDVSGKVVYEWKVEEADKQEELVLDLAAIQLGNGLYFLRSNLGTQAVRVVVR